MKKKGKIKKRSSSFSFLNFFKKMVSFFLFFSIIIFLGINIFFSQNISPLFLKVINFDYQSTVMFLKKIKNTPYFSKELNQFKKIYGQKLVNDVFFEEIEREKKIKAFESLLKLNPNSRDLLYNLYLLYKENGDEKLAQRYLQKVKEIDPWILNSKF